MSQSFNLVAVSTGRLSQGWRATRVLLAETCVVAELIGLPPARAAQMPVLTPTRVPVRVMAANLTGDSQKYEAPALRILRGLRPDVVAVQEFRYADSTAADLRTMVEAALGAGFVFYREPGYASGIPNGVISRFPILTAGSWPSGVSNRGFAWAELDLPGTNDLFVISVHFKAGSSDATTRATQAAGLCQQIQANVPPGALVVVAGDFNLQSRGEPALATLNSMLRDDPIPTDAESGGNPNTNEPRSRPYDLVLPNALLRPLHVPMMIGSRQFDRGLVFDSRLFTPLDAVDPVHTDDSGTAQHMAVLKEFSVPYDATNWVEAPLPQLVMPSPRVLQWQAPARVPFTVESSVDLVTWSEEQRVISETGAYLCTTAAPGLASRFYRVRTP